MLGPNHFVTLELQVERSTIIFSLIKDITPLATEAWKESNLMTARSLSKIAEHGGPRCCKRNSFLAIESAMDYLAGLNSEDRTVVCTFSHLNKECKKRDCPYFQNST